MVLQLLTKDKSPFCSVVPTVDWIGSKWKLLIMCEVLTGTKRFNEIHQTIDGVSQKVLTENSRKMEENRIIARTVYPEVPSSVEFNLSLNLLSDEDYPLNQ